MSFARDYKVSFWYSALLEFGEEVFVCNRKKFKISQTEIASRLGLSQSEISRLERGLTRPKNIVIAQEFCSAYRLSHTERRKYLDLVSGTPVPDTDLFSNLINNQIESIAYLNRSGSPKQAIQLSQNLSTWIESNSGDLRINTQSNIQFARLLLEESAAWWDIVLPDQVNLHTNSLISKMENISDAVNDSPSIYTHINKGFHAYINNNHNLAKHHFTIALSTRELVDDLWQVETLRASLITFGKLKDFNAVFQLEEQAHRLIKDEKCRTLEKGYVLEGLARAYAEFSLDKSLQLFELAQKYVSQARNEMNFMNIRLIQLTRSFLGVLKVKGDAHDKLVQLAAPALDEAEKSGFERHKNQILAVLNG